MHLTTFIKFILLVTIQIVLTDAAAVQHEDCQYREVNKCNKAFRFDFTVAQDLPQFSVYCRGYQDYANCLINTTCAGNYIDTMRFIIIQHMTVDKELKVCPHHNIDPLKNVLQVNDKYQKLRENLGTIEDDPFDECAKKIHVKCVSQYESNLISNRKICLDLERFYQCYKNPEISCNARIYTEFVKFIQKVDKNLTFGVSYKKGLLASC